MTVWQRWNIKEKNLMGHFCLLSGWVIVRRPLSCLDKKIPDMFVDQWQDIRYFCDGQTKIDNIAHQPSSKSNLSSDLIVWFIFSTLTCLDILLSVNSSRCKNSQKMLKWSNQTVTMSTVLALWRCVLHFYLSVSPGRTSPVILILHLDSNACTWL